MAMETSYLWPDGWFLFLLIAYPVLLIIGPAVDAFRQRRWGWVVAIVLLSPIAGLIWHAVRWTDHRRRTGFVARREAERDPWQSIA